MRSRHTPWFGAMVLAVVLAMAVPLSGCTASGAGQRQQGAQQAQQTQQGSEQGGESSTGSFDQIPDVVDEVRPSVVTIRTGKGLGSGVVYSSDGVIVTNRHVVARSKKRQAPVFRKVTVTFTTGKEVQGRVVGSDYRTDLAVVKVDSSGLRAAEFKTKLPEVGELAVAIGSPLGLAESVTAGIISGLNRSFPLSQTKRPLINLIQTDAPISPGSSGGALVNEDGKVVGISELYIPPKTGAVALGFAIPSQTVVDVVEQILKTGEAQHAFFGVGYTKVTPYVAKRLGLDQTYGVLVRRVVPGSGADRAGIRPGDVILAVGGQKLRSAEKFLAILRKHEPGDTVPVTLIRDGEKLQVEVTLTDRPGDGS